ncbi:MAG: hypothetical protein JWQ77_661 [Jatrophihabitans sp.]|nr:hypothetical protein [Jatrophihabitans sp.]
MWWQIGLVSNAAVAIAYLLITGAVLRPLIAGGQVRSNPLAAATAAIFFTCAIHHGGHVVHMLLPDGHVEVRQGLAMRASYDWEMATWDIVTAAVGVYYWTLRRAYSSLIRGAKLFDDLRQREHDALELNDNVLQGLVVAKLAFELDQRDRAMAALDASISAASRMVSDFLGPHQSRDGAVLLRSEPATLEESP